MYVTKNEQSDRCKNISESRKLPHATIKKAVIAIILLTNYAIII